MPEFKKGLAVFGTQPLGRMIGWILSQALLSKSMDGRGLRKFRTYGHFEFVIGLLGDLAGLGGIRNEEKDLAFFEQTFVDQLGEIEFFLFRHSYLLLTFLSSAEVARISTKRSRDLSMSSPLDL